MTGWTLSRRAERFVLVLLALASAMATVVVIGDASGSSDVRLAVLAAARGRALQSRAALVAALGARHPSAATVAPSVSADAGPADAGGSPPADNASSSPSGAGAADTGLTGTPAATAPTPASTSTPAATRPGPPASTAPAATVSHLFEIVLTGTGYASSFGPAAQMPYLRSLVARGTLLSGYRSLGDGPLADELALVSGQSPNADTSSGCPNYTEFPTGTAVTTAGLVRGAGCVYPETVLTLGDQISSAGHQWRAYIDGMGARSCQHANSDSVDDTVLPGSSPSYDTRTNPFIYFHSLLDLGDCASDDLDLSHLRAGSGRSAPSYSYLAPSLCAEPATPATSGSATTTSSTTPGSAPATTTTTAGPAASSTTTSVSTPSVTAGPAATPGCPAGQPTGVSAQDAFLKAWVPKLLASAAYRDKGALIIAFTAHADGGRPVRTGALLLTAATTHGRTLAAESDPYALLRATETALGLGLLGEAKRAAASDLFPLAHPSERTRSAGHHP